MGVSANFIEVVDVIEVSLVYKTASKLIQVSFRRSLFVLGAKHFANLDRWREGA